MVFDPSKIKHRRLAPDDLPPGASREEKILALANILLDRGLASSLSGAKSLAEGMVQTEEKVMKDGSAKESHESTRDAFQRVDSPLFQAVGGKPRLHISAAFRDFVTKAAPLSGGGSRMKVEQSPLRLPEKEEKHEQVFYDDVPGSKRLSHLENEWKVPQKKGDEGYMKTMVETSDAGVVVRDIEATATTDTVVERGIVLDDESMEDEVSQPEEVSEKKRAPEEDIDLFDIFKSGK